jgi:CheY-like chemotaxis protein
MLDKRKTDEINRIIQKGAKHWVVLAVDDEQDNLSVIEKVLAYQGAEVYAASNGIEALRILERITPTFILLDLSMPVMDGWETLEKIRENPLVSRLPVIAVTAHAMDGDREKALAAGFDGYIAKPFRINTFLYQIQECLEQMIPVIRGA